MRERRLFIFPAARGTTAYAVDNYIEEELYD
jgi:hypothetical protein